MRTVIIAIATDHSLENSEATNKPARQFDLNQPQQIADFIIKEIVSSN